MDYQKTVTIGIDLGGTSIKYAVVAPDGTVEWEGKKDTQAEKPAEQIIQNVIDAVLEAKEHALGAGKEPVCAGIGTPGIVDIDQGIVLGGADNLTDWVQIPLAERVSGATGLPVFIDNDANLMGLGEYAYGGNRHCRHLIFLTIGTGIGGAILINGQLYRGHRYAAAELGTIMMTYHGKDAYWEDFASTAAMVRTYQKQAVDLNPEVKVHGKYVFDRFLQNESLAVEVMREHTRLVGYGVAGYINIFNPEKIIIGGGISEAGKPYIQLIDEAARRYAMADCSRGVQIEAARMGNKAGFLGAAYFALDRMGEGA